MKTPRATEAEFSVNVKASIKNIKKLLLKAPDKYNRVHISIHNNAAIICRITDKQNRMFDGSVFGQLKGKPIFEEFLLWDGKKLTGEHFDLPANIEEHLLNSINKNQ